MTRRVRIAASPARVAAQTGPIPAGEHLAKRIPMPYRDTAQAKRERRLRVGVGLVGLVPVTLAAAAILSGVFGG